MRAAAPLGARGASAGREGSDIITILGRVLVGAERGGRLRGEDRVGLRHCDDSDHSGGR